MAGYYERRFRNDACLSDSMIYGDHDGLRRSKHSGKHWSASEDATGTDRLQQSLSRVIDSKSPPTRYREEKEKTGCSSLLLIPILFVTELF